MNIKKAIKLYKRLESTPFPKVGLKYKDCSSLRQWVDSCSNRISSLQHESVRLGNGKSDWWQCQRDLWDIFSIRACNKAYRRRRLEIAMKTGIMSKKKVCDWVCGINE
jgi:hypothetical protein